MALELVRNAEEYVAREAGRMTHPAERECVLCFVARMLDTFGCNNELRWATHWRDIAAPRATGLEGRLGRRGGYCDCEIFWNAYDPDWPGAQREDEPVARPRCMGVGRVGSSQPCPLWRVRRRGA